MKSNVTSRKSKVVVGKIIIRNYKRQKTKYKVEMKIQLHFIIRDYRNLRAAKLPAATED
jgi:hypothetical protein